VWGSRGEDQERLQPNKKTRATDRAGSAPWNGSRSLSATSRAPSHFRLVLIALNFVFKVPPMLFTAVMITRAMPAAIKPYSIAVAPDSSLRNRISKLRT
jgi:hypothetical protein